MPNKKPKQHQFENSKYKIDVVKHANRDVFRIIENQDELFVQRIDCKAGWKMHLLIDIHDKSTGKNKTVCVGPCSNNVTKIEIPIWIQHNIKTTGPKIAVILAGEAFRLGGQNCRLRDVVKSFDPQKRACLSHLSFLNRLKDTKNLDYEIFISSYSTRYYKDLLDWYGEKLVSYSFKQNLIGLQGLIKDAIHEINLEEYDSLLVSRIDIELKEYLNQVFDPAWEKIMFPSACWEKMGYLSRGNNRWIPRVSDTIEFVPKRFFGHIKEGYFYLNHQAWQQYRRSGLTDLDLGLFLDTFHDSDSKKDYNPLYKMAGRPESKKFYSPNLKIGKNLEPQRYYGAIKFPDWNQASTEPYEDENLIISPKYESFARSEVFDILFDKNSRKVTVKRKDENKGWNQKLILMVKFKSINQEKFLFVGDSLSNEKSISLDQKVNFYEDDKLILQMKDHDFPDAFLISKKDDNFNFIIDRVDSSDAWYHPHSVWVKEKSTGKVWLSLVGTSSSCSKTISIVRPPEKQKISIISGASKISKVALCLSSHPRINKVDEILSSINKHILEPNKPTLVDIFFHLCHNDSNKNLDKKYGFTNFLCEKIEMYQDEIEERCFSSKDFFGVCCALSMKRAIQIKEQHERNNNIVYDTVLVCKFDAPLQNNIDLKYDLSSGIFVDSKSNFFIMSSEDARLFKGLYDSPLLGNPCKENWIKNYIETVMCKKVIPILRSY